MKINNNILISRAKPKMRSRSKAPVQTNPTNDFGGSIQASQRKDVREADLLKTYTIEDLRQ